MARAKNTEERRAQITQGLARVMATKGYEGASIQAIAKEAGLSAGLVHYHFKRKLEILLGLVQEIQATADARVATFIAKESSAEEKLKAHLRAYVLPGNDANPRAVACWVVICAEALREKEVAHVVEGVLVAQCKALENRLKEIWQEDQKKVDDATTHRIATSLLAGVQGAFTIVSAAPSAFAPGFAAPALCAMATALIAEVRACR